MEHEIRKQISGDYWAQISIEKQEPEKLQALKDFLKSMNSKPTHW